MMQWDIARTRDDFPALHQDIRGGKKLIYFDNAATTQKPRCVLEAMTKYYMDDNANVHRGVHALSERATAAYEASRATIQLYMNAPTEKEIIFTKGTTDSINLVANSFVETFMEKGDEVILSQMEHHANIVPWQMLRDRKGIVLKIIPMDKNGDLIFEEYEKLFNEKTKFVSITHTSNALGTINPVKKMIAVANKHKVAIMLDGAQSIVHDKIDVQDLNCDFFTFSGHKVYGPTGTGVLFGKRVWLDKMLPYQGGGDMIRAVSFEETSYAPLPYKFEAGTPNIAGVIGLAAAINYIDKLGIDKIQAYEAELLTYATQSFKEIPGMKIYGEAKHKSPIISFILDGIHAHDMGTLLDQDGIAARAGHHCAMPVMTFFGIPATTRVSFSFYNTHAEIDTLVAALYKVKRLFNG